MLAQLHKLITLFTRKLRISFWMLLTAFLNTFSDTPCVFYHPSPGLKLLSTCLSSTIDLRLSILGMQASNVSMSSAIPTHLSRDTEFPCLYSYRNTVSVWEHKYWSTKANSITLQCPISETLPVLLYPSPIALNIANTPAPLWGYFKLSSSEHLNSTDHNKMPFSELKS